LLLIRLVHWANRAAALRASLSLICFADCDVALKVRRGSIRWLYVFVNFLRNWKDWIY
jgi:hypothetical protein